MNATLARRVLALGAALAVVGLGVAGRPYAPLYDGVLPVEPYRWLAPPPGEAGSPEGASARIPVSGAESPLVTVATPETAPQAQVFAIPGGLNLPAGTTEIEVSIAAILPPPGTVPDGKVITGNVYAISLTNQAGASITAKPEAQVSVVLRAPDPLQATAGIVRFDGATWQGGEPLSADVAATFETVVTEFGDFALVAGPPAPTAAGGPPGSAPARGPGTSGGVPSEPLGSTGTSTSSAPASGRGAVPAASPSDGGPAGGADGASRELLAVGLGGLAVIIVVLVAVAALGPGRGRSRTRPRGRRR